MLRHHDQHHIILLYRLSKTVYVALYFPRNSYIMFFFPNLYLSLSLCLFPPACPLCLYIEPKKHSSLASMFLSLFNYRLIVFLLEICVNFLPQDAPLWQQMNEHLRVSQGHFHTYLYNFRASKCISQPATFVPSRWPQVP